MTVSIIMPCYKATDTIRRAVQSIHNQIYQDWELLIIDDACPRNSYRIIEDIVQQDSRIKLLHNPQNLGVAMARNVGIKQAKGQYIAFLDADDYWLTDKLAQQIDILKKGYQIVFSSYFRESNGRRRLVAVPSRVNYQKLLKSNVIGNLTGIYNASKLGKVFQKEIGHEDYLMWLILLQKSDIAYGITEPLAVYSVAKNSLSGNKLKALRWQWHIYRQELRLNWAYSFYYFCFYILNAFNKRF